MTGPWGGMEERDSYRKPNQCEIAINCNFADGTIKARDGLRKIYNASVTARWQLHLVKKGGRAQYIIGAGPDSGNEVIKFAVWRPSGALIGTIATLGHDGSNEPYSPTWRCGFVDVILQDRGGTGNTKAARSHRVTLMVTSQTTYKIDTDGDPTDVHVVDMEGHAVKSNSANIAYIKHEPRAKYAIAHFASVVYAGFRPQQAFELDQNSTSLRTAV